MNTVHMNHTDHIVHMLPWRTSRTCLIHSEIPRELATFLLSLDCELFRPISIDPVDLMETLVPNEDSSGDSLHCQRYLTGGSDWL